MVCFLCGKSGHVSASCPYRPRWYDTAFSLAFAVAITAGWIAQALGFGR